ncbi:MAG: hypothetical protein J6Y02_11925 [Pseudobutyrivibrio sp.]|nr:hypothetical protein [Pseudobutyrivibrio sp.]
MDYRIKRVGQNDELEHALFGIGKKKTSSSSSSGSGQQGAKKGSTWSNHLYIARQKAGDGWRYFYSQAELKAAQAKKAGQKAASAVGDAAKKGVASVKRSVSDFRNYSEKVDQNISRRTEDIERRQGERRAIDDRYLPIHNQYDYYHPENNSPELEKRRRDNNDHYYENNKALEKAKDKLKEDTRETESVKYKASKIFSKTLSNAEQAINKGKSAISKFLSDERAMAKEAWNGSIAKKAIDKGKNVIDAISARRNNKTESSESLKETSTEVSPKNTRQYNGTSQKAESDESRAEKEALPKNTRQYNGTSKKAEGDETRATKDMYKNSSDEYIEDLYFNSRKNDGSGVSKYLENEYNYRKAAQEANYLGRLTNSLSNDVEAALKKYGKNSDTYKRAYKKMEEAFDKLHEAEMELARYEKNR